MSPTLTSGNEKECKKCKECGIAKSIGGIYISKKPEFKDEQIKKMYRHITELHIEIAELKRKIEELLGVIRFHGIDIRAEKIKEMFE